MAKAFYSNNVLMTIILFLTILLLFNVLYGCRTPTSLESFEDVVMNATEEKPEEEKPEVPENTLEQLESNISPIIDNKALKDIIAQYKETTTAMLKPSKEEEKKEEKKTEEVLSKKETELFEAISNNKITNEELEKLVKAGVVTEEMIERFLAKMDTNTEPSEVVEGFSCGRDYATF